MTSKQRPPANNNHYFWVPRVIVEHRFDCTLKCVAKIISLDGRTNPTRLWIVGLIASIFKLLSLYSKQLCGSGPSSFPLRWIINRVSIRGGEKSSFFCCIRPTSLVSHIVINLTRWQDKTDKTAVHCRWGNFVCVAFVLPMPIDMTGQIQQSRCWL